MPADGLTKVLPRQKFKEFVKQLDLVDITSRLRNIKITHINNIGVIFPNSS